MMTRYLSAVALAGLFLTSCSGRQGQDARSRQAAALNARENRYQLASREADPLAHFGVGTSAGVPDNPALGRYPGSLTPPISPVMGFGD